MKRIIAVSAVLTFLAGIVAGQEAFHPKRVKLEPADAVHFLLWNRAVEVDEAKLEAIREHKKHYSELISALADSQRPKLADTKLDLRWIEDAGSIFFEEVAPSTLATLGTNVAAITTR